MMKTESMLIIFLFAFLLLDCNTTEPPEIKNITLSVEDVSCTEAWLKVTSESTSGEIIITGDETEVKRLNATFSDTIVYIDSLLPSKTYTLQALLAENGNITGRSEKITAKTLDTTSHNFAWQSWTFGGGINSSYLTDVEIINENNIWAVGEIFINDSLGNPDYQPYSIAKWDGIEWKLKKLFYDSNSIIAPIRDILVLSKNDIYLAAGSIFHWDGVSSAAQLVYSRLSLPDPDATIEKLWGNSNSSLYGVGNAGTIVFFNGQNWNRIESGTEIRLTDIYGTKDGKNIWTCGWDNNHSGGVILQIDNPTTKLIWDGISNNGEYLNSINTLWTNGGEFWLAGGFVFRHSLLFSDKGHLVRIPIENGSILFDPGNFVLRIRGTKKNNIFLAGDLGMLWHFNGVRWYKFNELYNE
jgi:hypothetical protein